MRGAEANMDVRDAKMYFRNDCAANDFFSPRESSLVSAFGDFTVAHSGQTKSHLNVYDANEYSSSSFG